MSDRAAKRSDAQDPELDTDWILVSSALFCGVAAAMQIGKASAVLVALAEHFSVGIADTAVYLSLFSLGAAVLGTATGILAARVRPLRAGLFGLLLVGLGSIASSFSGSWTALLIARGIEALGLPLIVCTMPALIQSYSTGRQRILAMGYWAAWLPMGIALALGVSLLGPMATDWQLYLRVCGALPLVAAGLLAIAALRARARPQPAVAIGWPDRATLAVAVLFALFSANYLIVQGFLPSIAVDAWNFGTNGASVIGAVAALLVIAGNLAASNLLARGIPVVWLYTVAMAVMAVAAAALLTEELQIWIRVCATLVFTLCAGAPPAVIWALVPHLAVRAGIGAAIIAGVLYQGAGLGQLLGPVFAGIAIDGATGWSGAVLVTTGVAIASVCAGWFALRGMKP